MSIAAHAPPVAAQAVNYRRAVATLVPAVALAYVLILWPLIYAGNTVSADLAIAPAPVASGSFFLNKVFYPLLFCLAAALYLAERPAWSRDARASTAVLVLFLCYCMASAAWAIMPGRTVSQTVLVTMLLATIAIACQVSGLFSTIFRTVFVVFAVTLAINLASALTTPPSPIGHTGIYAHKNTLGAIAAFGLIMAVYGALQPARLMRLVGLGMIPVALFLLVRSESKTSLALALAVPVMAGGVWLAMRFLRLSLPVAVLLTLFGAMAATLFLAARGFTLGDASLLMGDDATFTGRTAIWDFALAEIAKQPLTGYGFRSFWGIGDQSPALHAPPGFVQVTPHAHNGYIDLMLELGYIGLALFGLVTASAFIRLGMMTRQRWREAFAGLCLVFYILLLNLLETSWLEPLDAGTIILAVLLTAPLSGRLRSAQPCP